MKKLYECNTEYAKRKLWNIRQDVRLGSIYFMDYDNRYDYSIHTMFQFFDGFLEYVSERMKEDIPGYNDNLFWCYIGDYDNKETLWEWYSMIDDPEF